MSSFLKSDKTPYLSSEMNNIHFFKLDLYHLYFYQHDKEMYTLPGINKRVNPAVSSMTM